MVTMAPIAMMHFLAPSDDGQIYYNGHGDSRKSTHRRRAYHQARLRPADDRPLDRPQAT